MITTYQLHTNELSAELIDSIRAVFRDRLIKINVSVALPAEEDNEEEDTNWKNNIDFWMGDNDPVYHDYAKKKEG